MSSSARDQCWLMLPTRRISPLGTCQTVPSIARSRVVRSDTASTVPVASPTSTMSPTPNWSSTRMKVPDRKSRTSDCEPKPIATPSTPAPASSGPRLMPTSPRHISSGGQPDHEAEHAAQHAGERVDALLGADAGLAGLEQRRGRALAHRAHALPHRTGVQLGQRALHGPAANPVRDEREEEDRDDPQRGPQQPVRDVRKLLVVEHCPSNLALGPDDTTSHRIPDRDAAARERRCGGAFVPRRQRRRARRYGRGVGHRRPTT